MKVKNTKITSENLNNQLKDIHAQMKELQKKESELRDQKIQLEEEEAEACFEKIKAAKDVLLPLLEHDRTSCSDDTPINGLDFKGVYRCAKCALINLLESDTCSGYKIRLRVDISNIRDRLVPFEF